jgi:hypothetical protein
LLWRKTWLILVSTEYTHVSDVRSFRHKPRQLIVEYYVHLTPTFEISFSGSSDTNNDRLL